MRVLKIAASVAAILIILSAAIFVFAWQNEIAKPDSWSANVKVYRTITGETRVFDGATGKFLLAYRSE